MWALGVVITVLAAVGAGQLLVRSKSGEPSDSIWDIPRTTATYTSIVGMLAGFTVVVTMFFANLTVARSSPQFEAVIGMLLLGFLLFISTAMMFGTTPNLATTDDDDYVRLQTVSYQLANLCYFCAIATSWLSLKLFLDAIGLPFAANAFKWVLLFTSFAGAMRMALFTLKASTLPRVTCVAVPFLGLGFAALFRLVVVPQVPALDLGDAEPFRIAICLFVVGAIGFSWQTVIIMSEDKARTATFLRARGDRLLLAFLQAVATTISMLWLAVATK